ncbi:uncharacterized protein [Nicotiana sylvestris]|uniref:uncharacterized protein n=1 Tax=Nicotiana sylvestris TaxID=4096 RepID=UPI00388C8828
MTNPQDKPGITPPCSSSSTTPQPRKQRVKMLARKTVARSTLSRKLNAQLQASQAQESQKSDDSFKSATKGEGIESSDSEQVTSRTNTTNEVISVLVENLENWFVLVGSVVDVKTPESRKRGGKNKREKEKESEGVRSDERGKGKKVVDSSSTSETDRMAICGVESEKVEENGKKTGESGSRKTTEGLVHLGMHIDELGSSVEETLADLLKKVGDSIIPRKIELQKHRPLAQRANKKRKDAPSDTTEIPLPRGRAMKSKLKQSGEELQKSLEKSKKKKMDKGKEKAGDPVEVVDVDEMDLIHQSEKVTNEVEVQTPQAQEIQDFF